MWWEGRSLRVGALGAGALLVASVALAGCSDGGDSAARRGVVNRSPELHAVGRMTDTFVSAERPLTAAAGSAVTDRALETTILYPAIGTIGATPIADAPPDRSRAPYPLIVFSHGLGASPNVYQGLLVRWAAAGYIVVAPAFPKTSTGSAGGIDPGDFANQPADVRAVITATRRAGTSGDGPLARMVDADEIGLAGHSLGGITTLGAAANSCCRDDRVKAAVVMAGDPLSFPKGRFEYAKAPPMLLVHGTDDELVTYEASVDVFNRARAPKGVLRIKGGDHGAPMNPTGPAFGSVARSTIDFFDAYLKDDLAARRRLTAGGASSETRLVFVAKPGTNATLPTAPTRAGRELEASVTPSSDLTDGQTVTVSWSGFTPGKTINIVQCSNRTPGDATACDLKHGKILVPNPTGHGSLSMQVVTGPVGSGICDSEHPNCQIVFNDGGSLEPSASRRVSISFAPE